jgi:hypothetical protein
VDLSGEKDTIVWVLEKDAQLSTRSLYNPLSFGGVCSTRMRELWGGAKIPLKVNIFLWQMFHEKLHTAEQLKKRNWKLERGDELLAVWGGGRCEPYIL